MRAAMETIELPRALEDYFAFAEVERRARARRFCITLPYLNGERLDRLQWWWQVGEAEEALLGEHGLARRRGHEIERFKRHITRWLGNTRQRLEGDGPIPRIISLRTDAGAGPPASAEAAAPAAESAADIRAPAMRAAG